MVVVDGPDECQPNSPNTFGYEYARRSGASTGGTFWGGGFGKLMSFHVDKKVDGYLSEPNRHSIDAHDTTL